jgi:hypothetical protein
LPQSDPMHYVAVTCRSEDAHDLLLRTAGLSAARRHPATVADGAAARKSILRICAFGIVLAVATGSCAPAMLPNGTGAELGEAGPHVEDRAEPTRPSVGVALLRDDDSKLPLDPRRITSVVVITSGSARGDMPGRHLAAALRDIFGDVRYHALVGTFDRKQAERASCRSSGRGRGRIRGAARPPA